MNQTVIRLTDEKMQEIYTNKKLRNAVAYAHGCYSSFPNSEFMHHKALCWPESYIVTDEQIKEAAAEVERAKVETAKKYRNSLLFVGMGMTYETETDIGNHRIRTEFLNKDGRRFFVELGTAREHEYCRCDFSIENPDSKDEKYNYANLEHNGKSGDKGVCRYTPEAVLDLVNRVFDCRFEEIFIDNYDLGCDGIMCESPKE